MSLRRSWPCHMLAGVAVAVVSFLGRCAYCGERVRRGAVCCPKHSELRHVDPGYDALRARRWNMRRLTPYDPGPNLWNVKSRRP